MGIQFVKNYEYSETSSSDSEIEKLLKVSYCSLKFSYILLLVCAKCFILQYLIIIEIR